MRGRARRLASLSASPPSASRPATSTTPRTASVSDEQTERVAVVVGATGTGKSAFSLDLADEIVRRGRPAEIVNADAMQLYRGMDIGTAKLPVGERRGHFHHLFDELGVTDEASVEWYQRRAREVIDGIVSRDAVPIVVGGSGLYVSGVVFDFQFPGTDASLRAKYERLLEDRGTGHVFQELKAKDPAAAAAIGPHNGRRLVRALEVGELTGAPFVVGLPDDAPTWRPAVLVGLDEERSVLTSRLDTRVDDMWSAGLLDEVEALRPLGLESGVTASRAIGYAQAIAQLKGEVTEVEAKDLAKALTRRYARRQVSWFKRYPRVDWGRAGDPAAVQSAADRLLA